MLIDTPLQAIKWWFLFHLSVSHLHLSQHQHPPLSLFRALLTSSSSEPHFGKQSTCFTYKIRFTFLYPAYYQIQSVGPTKAPTNNNKRTPTTGATPTRPSTTRASDKTSVNYCYNRDSHKMSTARDYIQMVCSLISAISGPIIPLIVTLVRMYRANANTTEHENTFSNQGGINTAHGDIREIKNSVKNIKTLLEEKFHVGQDQDQGQQNQGTNTVRDAESSTRPGRLVDQQEDGYQ